MEVSNIRSSPRNGDHIKDVYLSNVRIKNADDEKQQDPQNTRKEMNGNN